MTINEVVLEKPLVTMTFAFRNITSPLLYEENVIIKMFRTAC